MATISNSHRALILPGAVAKGAYEAGVIQMLIEKNIQIDRIVATSSGALNGVALAAGIRAGREKEVADQLVDAWIDRGGWHNSITLSPWQWLLGRGLSNRDGLLKMLTDIVVPYAPSAMREVELRIIVASLDGTRGCIGDKPATTYERVLHFSGKDFDTTEGLGRVFEATTAACAFPGLFAPVNVAGVGPCIDGGAVNNAPIQYALDECGVSGIIMAIPFPEVMPIKGTGTMLNQLNHMVEILINERLYRDLKNAETVNREVATIEEMGNQGLLQQEQVTAIKRALKIRMVEITEVRPAHHLPGNSFSGFFSRDERIKLVAAGREAARMAFANEAATTQDKKNARKDTRLPPDVVKQTKKVNHDQSND